MMNSKRKETILRKKNPLWDKALKHELMKKDVSGLPEFLKLAIRHERNCIEFRLRQVENYFDRLELMFGGMDYFDTFERISPLPFVQFPKQEYEKLKMDYFVKKGNKSWSKK
jgi:hypothetical protein